jgi:hypothetical protein
MWYFRMDWLSWHLTRQDVVHDRWCHSLLFLYRSSWLDKMIFDACCKSTLLSPSNVHDGSLSSRIIPKPVATITRTFVIVRLSCSTYHIDNHDHRTLHDILEPPFACSTYILLYMYTIERAVLCPYMQVDLDRCHHVTLTGHRIQLDYRTQSMLNVDRRKAKLILALDANSMWNSQQLTRIVCQQFEVCCLLAFDILSQVFLCLAMGRIVFVRMNIE